MDKEYNNENKLLQETLFVVSKLLHDKDDSIHKLVEDMKPWDGVVLEASLSYNTAKNYHRIDTEWKAELEKIYENPYYGRMIFVTKDPLVNRSIKKDVQVGLYELRNGVEIIIHEWRSNYGDFYYQNSLKEYKDDKSSISDHMMLKRKIHIENAKLIDYKDVYSDDIGRGLNITDPFLQQVLLEKRKNPFMTNIVSTIQKRQNEIIRGSYSDSILVDGCAGSGKTMVMLHKISYLTYNSSKLRETYRIIVPSNTYIKQVQSLMKEIKIEDIQIQTLGSLYREIILYSGVSLGVANLETYSPEILTQSQIEYIYSERFLSDLAKNYENRLLSINENTIKQLAVLYRKVFEKQMQNVVVDLHNINLILTELSALLITSRERYNEKSKLLSQQRRLEKEIKDLLDKINEKKSSAKIYEVELAAFFDKAEGLGFIGNRSLYCSQTKLFDYLNKSLSYWKLNDFKKVFDKVEELLRYFVLVNLSSEITNKKIDMLKKLIIDFESNWKFVSLNNPKKKEIIVEVNKLFWAIISPIERYLNKKDNESLRIDIAGGVWKRFTDNYFVDEDIANLLIKEKEQTITRERLLGIHGYVPSADELNLLTNYESELYDVSKNVSLVFYRIVSQTFVNAGIQRIDQFLKYPTKLCLFVQVAFLSIIKSINPININHISIDEAQDISYPEYLLLRQMIKENTVVCLYGDLNQAINPASSLSSWSGVRHLFKLKNFDLKQNYRNSRQITEYTNRVFGQRVQSTAIDDEDVLVFSVNELGGIFDELYKDRQSLRIAIILDDLYNPAHQNIVNSLMSKYSDLRINSIEQGFVSLIDIKTSKGLEFEVVLVMEEGMNRNQKYVAYTRALNKLYISSKT